MHHAPQLVHAKLDLFISNLISHPIDITWRRAGVLNLHTICTTIEYLLHRPLTTSDYAFVDYSSHQCQQIRLFFFGLFVVFVDLLKCHLNDHKSCHLDNIGYDGGIFISAAPSLGFDC